MVETPSSEAPAGALLEGLPPVAHPSARVLVLGSMPGVRSLEEQRYYAHPRNAFWPIVEPLIGVSGDRAYPERLDALVASGIALWDVIGVCRRPGSLDSRIETDSIAVNDLGGLVKQCPKLALVAFNGARAEQEFRRRVLPDLGPAEERIDRVRLPSTSPAHAAMTLAEKRRRWHAALGPVLVTR